MTDKKLKKNDEVNLKIDRLLFGGDGVGSVDGLKVFLPRSVPGDLWQTQVTRVKSNYAEARGLKLLEPSAMRVEARCPYFEHCGGCSYQFISEEEQLRQKGGQVRDALERIGGLELADFRPIVSGPVAWRYRNKMEFSFATSERGELELGLHPRGYHYEVLNLEQCFLISETAEALMRDVRVWAQQEGLKAWHPRRASGPLRSLIVRESRASGEIMLILQIDGKDFSARKSWVERFGSDPRIQSLYLQSVVQKEGSPTKVIDTLLSGSPVLKETLKLLSGTELQFEILPQSFFQTNSAGAEVLYGIAVDLANLQGTERVLDLYCGTGTIGLFMAGQAQEVLGVDWSENAIVNARENAVRNGVKNARFIAGDAAAVLKTENFKADVLVVDPPRSGLSPQAIEEVLGIRATRLIYVSCNPSTLARDLKILCEAGYKLGAIQPVEMFPQTAHVETVAQLALN